MFEVQEVVLPFLIEHTLNLEFGNPESSYRVLPQDANNAMQRAIMNDVAFRRNLAYLVTSLLITDIDCDNNNNSNSVRSEIELDLADTVSRLSACVARNLGLAQHNLPLMVSQIRRACVDNAHKVHTLPRNFFNAADYYVANNLARSLACYPRFSVRTHAIQEFNEDDDGMHMQIIQRYHILLETMLLWMETFEPTG